MKRALILSLLFILATTLWILSGSWNRPPESPASSILERQNESSTRTETPRVSVLTSQAQTVANDITVNGRTKAARIVDILAETEGRIIDVPVARGARITAGTVIARIEIKDRKALVAKARQEVRQKEIESSAAQGLSEKGYNSKVRLAGTEAELEAARAELKRAEVDLGNTEIRAPFDGALEERVVEIGSFVQAGTPVGKIVDLDPIHIIGYISEQRIGEIRHDNQAFATLPNGQEAEGKISYIATTADEATRTFRIEVEIPNPDNAIVEGLTTRLRIPVATEKAHRISPAILSLDDSGVIGVKTVDENNIAGFHPVTLAGDAPGGIWVRGLPDNIRLITVGQEFVTPGQKVEAAETTPEALP